MSIVTTRIRDTDDEPDGPPWPLSHTELAQFQELGFQEVNRDLFDDNEPNTVKHIRIEYLKVGS
ncbi:MAG: hypothetical protein WBB28_16315 [Crinalium sp.]